MVFFYYCIILEEKKRPLNCRIMEGVVYCYCIRICRWYHKITELYPITNHLWMASPIWPSQKAGFGEMLEEFFFFASQNILLEMLRRILVNQEILFGSVRRILANQEVLFGSIRRILTNQRVLLKTLRKILANQKMLLEMLRRIVDNENAVLGIVGRTLVHQKTAFLEMS